jgi:hypothetical protein
MPLESSPIERRIRRVINAPSFSIFITPNEFAPSPIAPVPNDEEINPVWPMRRGRRLLVPGASVAG